MPEQKRTMIIYLNAAVLGLLGFGSVAAGIQAIHAAQYLIAGAFLVVGGLILVLVLWRFFKVGSIMAPHTTKG